MKCRCRFAWGDAVVHGSEAAVKIPETGPLHNLLPKREVNLIGWDNFEVNLNQIATTVKEILLDYPSDYDSKSIEKADRRRFKVSPSSLLKGREGAANDFDTSGYLGMPSKS